MQILNCAWSSKTSRYFSPNVMNQNFESRHCELSPYLYCIVRKYIWMQPKTPIKMFLTNPSLRELAESVRAASESTWNEHWIKDSLKWKLRWDPCSQKTPHMVGSYWFETPNHGEFSNWIHTYSLNCNFHANITATKKSKIQSISSLSVYFSLAYSQFIAYHRTPWSETDNYW